MAQIHSAQLKKKEERSVFHLCGGVQWAKFHVTSAIKRNNTRKEIKILLIFISLRVLFLFIADGNDGILSQAPEDCKLQSEHLSSVSTTSELSQRNNLLF